MSDDTVNGATLTITDDDAAPGDIGLTLSSTSVAESASATTVTVTAALGGSTRFAADKAITVEVGASTDGATEGTDYDTGCGLHDNSFRGERQRDGDVQHRS